MRDTQREKGKGKLIFPASAPATTIPLFFDTKFGEGFPKLDNFPNLFLNNIYSLKVTFKKEPFKGFYLWEILFPRSCLSSPTPEKKELSKHEKDGKGRADKGVRGSKCNLQVTTNGSPPPKKTLFKNKIFPFFRTCFIRESNVQYYLQFLTLASLPSSPPLFQTQSVRHCSHKCLICPPPLSDEIAVRRNER